MPKSALTNAEKADAYAREFKCLTRREQKLICTLYPLLQKGSAARKSFPNVDALVFGIRKIFKKSPRRVRQFREICPELAIAPRTSFYSIDYLAEGGSLFEQPSCTNATGNFQFQPR